MLTHRAAMYTKANNRRHGSDGVRRREQHQRRNRHKQKWPRSLGAVCMNPNRLLPSRGAYAYFFFLAGAFFFAAFAFFVAFFID